MTSEQPLSNHRTRTMRALNELTHHLAWPSFVRQHPEALEVIDALLEQVTHLSEALASEARRRTELRLIDEQLALLRGELRRRDW